MTTRSCLIPLREIQSFNLVEGIRGFRHRYILVAKLRSGDELPLFNVPLILPAFNDNILQNSWSGFEELRTVYNALAEEFSRQPS